MSSQTLSSDGCGRVAIVFPADELQGLSTNVLQSRFKDVAKALASTGFDVIGAPYADTFIDAVRAQLLTTKAVLVWLNPIEAGRDRTILNAMLSDVANHGVLVSAHPDMIARMGTKEVLHRTRNMGWGCDTRLYDTADALRAGLLETLSSGGARVVKQMRGQSGDGVWKIQLADLPMEPRNPLSLDSSVVVRHAKRGGIEVQMPLRDFLSTCAHYFTTGGMIEQPYQERLPEGMIRCYVVGDRVAGFGEQLINALYPAAPGTPPSSAPQPGPRHYFPSTRSDLQALKHKLESEWIAELCQILRIDRTELPILWDADFLYGAKNNAGADTYVLCEINVSSVYPFPDDAMTPLVECLAARLAGKA